MKIEWISCKERLPEVGDGFLVIVKTKWEYEKDWSYDVDYATSFGDYVDGFWDTYNDWHEGEEVHITHWADTYNDWHEGEEVHITHWAEIPKPDFEKISLEG